MVNVNDSVQINRSERIRTSIIRAIQEYAKENGYIKKNGEISINQTVAKLGISRQTYYNWLQPSNKQKPDTCSLQKLHEITGYDYEYLLGEIDEKHKEAHTICEATGLSEAAVDTLTNSKRKKDLVDSISKLLKENPNTKIDEDKYREAFVDNGVSEARLSTINEFIEFDTINYLIWKYINTPTTIKECILEFDTRQEDRFGRYNDFSGIESILVNGHLIDADLIRESLMHNIRNALDLMVKHVNNNEPYPNPIIV